MLPQCQIPQNGAANKPVFGMDNVCDACVCSSLYPARGDEPGLLPLWITSSLYSQERLVVVARLLTLPRVCGVWSAHGSFASQ